jgi:hypothetical protein
MLKNLSKRSTLTITSPLAFSGLHNILNTNRNLIRSFASKTKVTNPYKTLGVEPGSS